MERLSSDLFSCDIHDSPRNGDDDDDDDDDGNDDDDDEEEDEDDDDDEDEDDEDDISWEWWKLTYTDICHKHAPVKSLWLRSDIIHE